MPRPRRRTIVEECRLVAQPDRGQILDARAAAQYDKIGRAIEGDQNRNEAGY